MNLICETNLFYNISSGHIKLSAFSASSDILYFSPISLLEIAGGIRKAPETLESRKAAGAAILSSNARLLPDVDSWIANMFGYEPEIADEVWKGIANGIPHIEQYSDTDGLAHILGTPQRLNIGGAATWRADQEKEWQKSVCQYLDHAYPPLAAYYRTDKNLRGEKPKIKGKDKKAFISDVNNNRTIIVAEFLRECASRAGSTVGKVFADEPKEEREKRLEKAHDPLQCYCTVMANFMISLVTENRRVEENDHLDSEFFPYLIDDDHILVTSEKKWADYCSKAGFANRVRLVS